MIATMLLNSPLFVSLFVLGTISFAIYKFLVYPALISPLSRIPTGHWTAPFSPLWSYYIKLYEIENTTVLWLHQKKGPIIRLGPSELSVNCYEGGIKTIYGGGFDKPEYYFHRFSNYGRDAMFTVRDGKAHSIRKRMVSNVYAKSTILASQTLRGHATTVLCKRLMPLWAKSADTHTPLEVHRLNYASSLDMFMGYQYGSSLAGNFIEDTKKRDWFLDNFFSPRKSIFWISEIPRITSLLEKIGVKAVPEHTSQSIRELEDWNLEVLDSAEKRLVNDDALNSKIQDRPVIYETLRTKSNDSKSDSINSQKPGETIAQSNRLSIAADMLDHLAAAHETSGDTLTYLMYEMSNHPELQIKLRAEILTLERPFVLDNTTNDAELPDAKALDSLPLLDAIIHETLRQWVSVPGAQPRVTPSSPCTLAGYSIPPGTRVQSYAYCLHRNPDVFPEPEQWKPQRWLEASSDQLVEMRRWFWAFSSGGRMCVGSNIAMFSMKHIVAALYTNFRTSIHEVGDMEQKDGFTGGPKGEKLILKLERAL